MTIGPEALQAVGDLLHGLRRATTAGRTTLRVGSDDGTFPVVAEARAEGMNSLLGNDGNDFRGVGTFEFIAQERRVLVQGDIANDDIAAPPELISAYGTRAQMLAPIVVAGRLAAFISVHVPEIRVWTDEDVAALERARDDIASWIFSASPARRRRGEGA